MTDFLSSFSKSNAAVLRNMLKRLARHGISWTLPVLEIRDLGGKEKVLGLPTLSVGIPNVKEKVNWEVRYKKVDMDGIAATEGVGAT